MSAYTRSLIALIITCFSFVQCAGRFEMVEGGRPRVTLGASAMSPTLQNSMDEVHDENFKMPPEKKDSLTDKAGMIIVAAVVVAVAVASAVAIPLLLANK